MSILMALSVLVLGTAVASENDFVQVFRPTGLGEPSFAPCVVARKTRATKPRTDVEIDAKARYPGWTVVGLAPEADNSAVPPDVLARVTGDLDLSTIPPEPLYGDPADIQKLHDVFVRAASRKQVVRIGVWGDSHTTGDNLPGQLRRILQNRYGDAGSGFVMPFSVFANSSVGRVSSCEASEWTNAISDVAATPGAGPSGATATSNDPNDLAWVLAEEEARPKAKMWISVLYRRQEGGGTLRLLVDQAQEIKVPTGGAAGAAVAQIELPLGTHRVGLAPAGDGPVTVAGVTVERQSVGGGGVVVDGLGGPGRGYFAWKSWDVDTMKQWINWRPYDLFIMVAGSGDGKNVRLTEAEFRKTLEAGLQTFRSFAPDAACLLVGPADRAHLVGDDLVLWGNHAIINKVIREVAPSYHCASWSMQEAMGGVGTTRPWIRAGLMEPDDLHFTPTGYRLWGSKLVDLLDPRSP